MGRVDMFQTVPCSWSWFKEDMKKPDLSYAFKISAGMRLNSTNGTQFRTTEDVNFKYSFHLIQ